MINYFTFELIIITWHQLCKFKPHEMVFRCLLLSKSTFNLSPSGKPPLLVFSQFFSVNLSLSVYVLTSLAQGDILQLMVGLIHDEAHECTDSLFKSQGLIWNIMLFLLQRLRSTSCWSRLLLLWRHCLSPTCWRSGGGRHFRGHSQKKSGCLPGGGWSKLCPLFLHLVQISF